MRILLGLWLLQAFSAGVAWIALSGANTDQVMLSIGLVMGTGMLAALWFATALRDQRRLCEAQQSERMAKTTAKLQADLARQRATDTARLRALIDKVGQRRSRVLWAGLLAAAALGVGLALLLTQLLALAVAAAAGGVAGFALRGRPDRRALRDTAAAEICVSSALPAREEAAASRRRFLSRSAKRRAA